MKKKQYTIFFANLTEAWFQRYPEQTALFGTTIGATDTLSPEQAKQLQLAVEKRKDQLKNRFKNLFGSTKAGRQSKADANNIFQAVLGRMSEGGKGHRGYQEVEAYSKLFFEQRIKGAITEKLARVGEELGKMDIQRIKEETRALYLTEPEEVKEQVREFAKTARRDSKQREPSVSSTEEIWTSDQNEKNIEKLAAVVNKFIAGLQGLTGWSFTLLAGGPSPELDGKIDAYSFHAGLTTLGNDFSRAYPGFDKDIMGPFVDFLHRVHVLKPKEGGGATDDSDDAFKVNENEEGEGMNGDSGPPAGSNTFSGDGSPGGSGEDVGVDTSSHEHDVDVSSHDDTQPQLPTAQTFPVVHSGSDISQGLSLPDRAVQDLSTSEYRFDSQDDISLVPPMYDLASQHDLSHASASHLATTCIGASVSIPHAPDHVVPTVDPGNISFLQDLSSVPTTQDSPYLFDINDTSLWLGGDFDNYLANLTGGETYGDPNSLVFSPVQRSPVRTQGDHLISKEHSSAPYIHSLLITPPHARRFLNHEPLASQSSDSLPVLPMVHEQVPVGAPSGSSNSAPPPPLPADDGAPTLDSEKAEEVRHSRSGRVILPATRNAVANSIGKENVHCKARKRVVEDDDAGASKRRRS